MQINIPPKVRFAIYIFTGIASIVVAYLSNSGRIGANEVEAWVALSAFVNGLAAANVTGVR